MADGKGPCPVEERELIRSSPEMLTTNQTGERTDIFASDDLFQNKLHLQRYQFTLDHFKAGERCLEVGAGLGVFSRMLCEHGLRYAGIEIDSEACEQAQRRVGSRDLIRQADAHQLPFPDASFDVAVCLEVLEHLRDYRQALAEIRRVLRPSGKLIASIPYRKEGGSGYTNPFYGPNPFHLYEPGEQEFRETLERNFERVVFFYQAFKEPMHLTIARRLRLRRLLGLVEPYRKLTAGHPEALERIAIGARKSGLTLALLAVAEFPKD